MTTSIYPPESIIRRKQVQAQTGLSRSGIYQMISEGNFPNSVKIGHRAVGWLQTEVNAWIASRIHNCRKSGDAS